MMRLAMPVQSSQPPEAWPVPQLREVLCLQRELDARLQKVKLQLEVLRQGVLHNLQLQQM